MFVPRLWIVTQVRSGDLHEEGMSPANSLDRRFVERITHRERLPQQCIHPNLRGCQSQLDPLHSGSGFPFVSGANQISTAPTK